MVSKDNIRIMITIPKEILEKIQKLAKADNRTISNFIVSILLKNIK